MIKEVLKTFRKPALLFSSSLGLCLGMACQDDVVAERQPIATGDEIMFAVASDSIGDNQSVGAISRSASKVSTHFLTTIGKDSLYLEVREEENNRPFHTVTEDTVASRGAAYSNDAFGEFFLTAFLDDGAQFMNETYVEKKNGSWTYSPVKYWPQNQAVHFWGYAKSPDKGGELNNHEYDINSCIHSFHYTMPEPGNDMKDAEKQPDLIVAIQTNRTKQNTNGMVKMDFEHALSAVVFKIGEVPKNITITKVEFSGIYKSGTCKAGQNIEWFQNNTDETGTYTQGFDYEAFGDGGNPKNHTIINTTSEETCFMMVPQGFSNDARIHIYFKVEDRDYYFNRTLKSIMGSSSWKADMIYTYTISLPEEVKVEVSDNVDGKVKSGLQIINTGLADACYRVAIMGSWVVESDVTIDGITKTERLIVADWKENEGTFNWGASAGMSSTQTSNNWRKGTDGYYYYMQPVSRGEELNALFETYTLTASPPMPGAYLELSILAEAAYWKSEDVNDVSVAWPEDMYNALIQPLQ